MADNVNNPGSGAALPLEGMAKLSPSQLQALKSRWLTTVEAMVGAAATEEGRAGLCTVLEASPSDLDLLLQEARGLLGDERFEALMTPTPGGPTGALLDEGEDGGMGSGEEATSTGSQEQPADRKPGPAPTEEDRPAATGETPAQSPQAGEHPEQDNAGSGGGEGGSMR